MNQNDDIPSPPAQHHFYMPNVSHIESTTVFCAHQMHQSTRGTQLLTGALQIEVQIQKRVPQI